MRRTLLIAILAASCWSCADNEECTQLQAVLKARRAILQSARAQAGALEVLQKRATAAETAAQKLMRSLWFSEPESKIQETLEKRAKAIPGATMERTTTPTSLEDPKLGPISETMWVFRFRESSVEKAFNNVDLLTSNPPLVRISAILREKKSDWWRVEVVRVAIDQVPINPKPTPLAPPEDLSAIPKQLFGFCGAGRLRDDIYETDAEIRSLMERAEQTTVLLPAMASWDGLRGRAELARDLETENRRILRILRDSAANLPLKGLGVEGAQVFLELWGGKKERTRLEEELARRGASESAQFSRNSPDGVVRVMMTNPIESARRQRKEGKEHAGHPEGELPPDHPHARQKTVEPVP